MTHLWQFLQRSRRRRLVDPLQDTESAGAAFELAWRAALQRRIVVIVSMLALWVCGVEGRLVQLQLFQHDELVERARRQQQRVIEPIAKRGDIVDRHGQILAYSVDAATVVADPGEVKDPEASAAAICVALGDCTADRKAAILKSLRRKGSFAFIARQVSDNQARRVADLKVPGITQLSESHRYYPKFELAAHVLGFVNIDNEGLGGVELAYDSTIRGHKGLVLVQKDAHQNRMLTRVERAATAGATLELSIDLYLQHIAERELRAGIEERHAKGGAALVMDPRSGEILALASYPTFNPNVFNQFSDDERRDRAIQDLYEPGSTFKIVTASAAIGEGIVQPTDVIDCSPGYITFPGRKPIRDVHQYGVLSFEDVIVKSSNVGAIRVGLRVGAERLGRYVRRFGFGETLTPDLRGESPGIVWNPADLNDSAVASMSMGYQVGVTPLQMATAVSAIANGGTLIQPRVVRAIVRGDQREPIAPTVLRQAIAPNTAATLTTIMEEVVLRGTGKKAKVDGYQVAGKTGTAAKLENGHYSNTDYNASFVGFVPSRQPALAIVVVVDTPRGGSYFGGDIAAPIFRRIAEASLRQLAVPRTINPTPPIVIADAAAPPAVPTPARTASLIPALVELDGRTLMPDVRGLSAREALRVIINAGLSVRFLGAGFVVAQTPKPGEPVERGGVSVLELQREGGAR